MESSALSLAPSIRKSFRIKADTLVRQFICKAAGEDATCSLPPNRLRTVERTQLNGEMLWGKKKKKAILSHTITYIDLENPRLLHKKQNKDFKLTLWVTIYRIRFKNTSLWKCCSAAVKHNWLRVNKLVGGEKSKQTYRVLNIGVNVDKDQLLIAKFS